jgi:DNA-directed RNA polymerase specialized sigma24 family protein
MASQDAEGEDGGTGNEPWDDALFDFETKGGYGPGFWYDDDEFDKKTRKRNSRLIFEALLDVASPQERVVLEAALAQIKARQPLNWEAIARDLGKSSGAVKTQVRRAAAKLLKKL